MTPWALGVPLALQGSAMVVDEWHFHLRRGLPRWERIGHPLDTLTVVACLAVAAALPPERRWIELYAALAVFSCLFVTKDERVHAKQCSPGEHWLHAVLFVLHPIVLATVAMLWVDGLRTLVAGQAALTVAFGLWQALYWNLAWSPRCTSPEPRATAR